MVLNELMNMMIDIFYHKDMHYNKQNGNLYLDNCSGNGSGGGGGSDSAGVNANTLY